jgi:hypothetical protein
LPRNRTATGLETGAGIKRLLFSNRKLEGALPINADVRKPGPIGQAYGHQKFTLILWDTQPSGDFPFTSRRG